MLAPFYRLIYLLRDLLFFLTNGFSEPTWTFQSGYKPGMTVVEPSGSEGADVSDAVEVLVSVSLRSDASLYQAEVTLESTFDDTDTYTVTINSTDYSSSKDTLDNMFSDIASQINNDSGTEVSADYDSVEDTLYLEEQTPTSFSVSASSSNGATFNVLTDATYASFYVWTKPKNAPVWQVPANGYLEKEDRNWIERLNTESIQRVFIQVVDADGRVQPATAPCQEGSRV